MKRQIRWVLAALALFVSGVLIAEEPVDQQIAGRFEVDAFFYDVSVSDVFVTTPYMWHLSAGYHVFEWLSLEAITGYAFASGESALMQTLRKGTTLKPDLPGMWAPTWLLGSNVVFAPIVGKLNLWSELQSHFQLYVFLPLAGEGIKRVVSVDESETAARFATGFGAGMRFFALDRLTLRAEFKQSYAFNPPLLSGARDVASTTWLSFGIGYLF